MVAASAGICELQIAVITLATNTSTWCSVALCEIEKEMQGGGWVMQVEKWRMTENKRQLGEIMEHGSQFDLIAAALILPTSF